MPGSSESTSLQTRLGVAFQGLLPIPESTERHLHDALAETLERTGNLMRAQLAFRVARAYRVPDGAALELSVALEYFHTASLLFDDLPSMDDATYRRGAMCIHHLYGEGSAILAGLALVNRAYALLWKAVATAAPDASTAALEYVERHLGLGGLLNGQSLDLHYTQLPHAERVPQAVAMGKTVALIRLSLVLPALVGGAGPQAIRLLDRLAVFWGLSYQAIDDLKDVLHATERAGKTTKRDTLLDRPNLALSLGLPAANARLRKLIQLGGRVIAPLQTLEPALICLDAPRRRLEFEVDAIAGELIGGRR